MSQSQKFYNHVQKRKAVSCERTAFETFHSFLSFLYRFQYLSHLLQFLQVQILSKSICQGEIWKRFPETAGVIWKPVNCSMFPNYFLETAAFWRNLATVQ